jgi:hypothetical protein
MHVIPFESDLFDGSETMTGVRSFEEIKHRLKNLCLVLVQVKSPHRCNKLN